MNRTRRRTANRFIPRFCLVLVSLGLWKAVIACSSSDDKPPALETGGVGGFAGFDSGRPDHVTHADAGAGGETSTEAGEGGLNSPLAPAVAITSPGELNQPTDGAVLIVNTVEVLCTATQSSVAGSKAVDPSTVRLELLDASETVLDSQTAVATANPNEYRATFTLTAAATGRISFRCSASDRSIPALKGSTTIGTFIDHGPIIDTPSSPAPDSVWALKGGVPFAFTVRPSPLVTPDPDSAVSNVNVVVNGYSIPKDQIQVDATGQYTFSVNLADKSHFSNLGQQIGVQISATNSRKPTAVVSTYAYTIKLDVTGPQIAILDPVQGSVVGGPVVLDFTVKDDLSQVKKSSVVVNLSATGNKADGTNFTYTEGAPEWSLSGDKYTLRFDTRALHNVIAQFTINIQADDTVGNSATGESQLVYIDTQAPLVDLDPAPIRELTPPTGVTPATCSDPFDPLGEATSDTKHVEAFGLFRALVWERANGSTGTGSTDPHFLHYSGVDTSSVYLYLQNDPSKGALINTTGDNRCDDVTDALKNTSRVSFIQLNPVPPQGTSFYGLNGTVTNTCANKVPPDLTSPPLLCNGHSDLTRVINHEMAGINPVIFAVGSLEGIECTGTDWEIYGATPTEGWVCLVARAVDKAGNVGVSAPLRICRSDGVAPEPACAVSSVTPPSCTDGCTPERFTQQVIIRQQ